MRDRSDVVMVLVAALVAAAGAWLLRDYLLDDAFIHLRYAHNFAALHRITYDGMTPSQGDSSLGYLLLMAGASLVVPGAMLPKLISLFLYTGLFALVACSFLRAEGRRKWLAGASLLVIVSPFGQRWLVDGMESALVAIVAILIAIASATRRTPAWILALLGFVAVLLRVEFLFVLALATLGRTLRATGWGNPFAARYGNEWVGWAAAMLGGATGALLLGAVFGHLLPDTAVAKQTLDRSILRELGHIASAHLGASIAGVGLAALWFASLLAVLAGANARDRLATLAVNAGLALFLVLLVVEQQQIQGIRYFVFIYAFLIAWNVCLAEGRGPILAGWRTAAVALVALLWGGADTVAMAHVLKGRAEMHRLFTGADLSALRDQPGLAWDIGYVGYFGGGRIWDVNGLVNGRAMAALPLPERLRLEAAQPIRYVFANRSQLRLLRRVGYWRSWPCVFHVDITNVRNSDRHWLLADPALARQLIAANPQWPDAGCPFRRPVEH